MEIFRATAGWFLENGGAELTLQHHKEVPSVTAKGVTEIDYGVYQQLEKEGLLLIMVAWEDDRIVGYVIGNASPAPHNLGAYDFNTTAFYTIPEVRNLGIGKQLFETTCQYCVEHGITDINYAVSESFPAAKKAVEQFGMVKAETIYSKRLVE